MAFIHLLAIVIALAANIMGAQAKAVFAHFMVGNTYSYNESVWLEDMQMAKAAHIDGFALNIGADSYTEAQLAYAYAAAEEVGGFSLFISFDYGTKSDWTTQNLIDLMSKFKDHPAQYKLNGKALVSTFEGGDAQLTDWNTIGEMYSLVPSWTSLGPRFEQEGRAKQVAGAFAWSAWPTYPDTINTKEDEAWKSMLGGKPYMMAVSPWFFADCYDKNWLWSGDNLWHDRWQQVIEFQPEFVEIITWNDYGESHYIGPLRAGGFPTGSERYVGGMPHDGFREMLPYWIDAYKNGNTTTAPQVTQEKLVYYHRINPSSSGNTGGTTANTRQLGQTPASPAAASQDAIFIDVLVSAPSDVSVQIGQNSPKMLRATTAGINHLSVDFTGQTGEITYTVSRDGKTVLSTSGPGIIAATVTDPVNGLVNWNAYVGSSS